ncbi:MAG: SulP family inorganic anion transporter [Thiohalophilus sp.]|uniref:SulP family inorganic anion transporter n=1 Tax=Thiohalophilus sp. TaxID=3028392 RepID=UPI00287052E5|nr:SulP family inorganic anion transporter [Thiohalophilus sp.]MDR9437608.1 SulP family inorganic anion transporter [Thiohalophilus sp.]
MAGKTLASRRYAGWWRWLPMFSWWPNVNRTTLRVDFLAGLTGAIVVLPQGVAFATIAGMPPEYGLYAGMVPAIVAALFGSSWHLVSGPTTAASIVLFSVLSAHAEPGTALYVQLALTLTFMVGVVQLVMGFAKLGTLVNFISHSVVIGFTAGAAILIATKQIQHFFGIEITRGADFIETLKQFALQITDVNPYVLTVSVITLILGIATRRLFPRAPYMVVAMLGGSLAAVILSQLIGSQASIPAVGALPAVLPPLSSPDFSMDTLRELAPGVIAVTLLALTEAVSIARALAVRSGQQIDGNQEFIGQGLSNIVGSFFSAYVATGSFNRSGLNYEAGARTPLASIIAALLLMLIVLFVAPLVAYLPNAAMAAILFLVAWGLIDFHHIRQILRVSRSEAAIMATTFFATLLLDLETAIMLGVMLSLGIYLSRTSRPNVLARVPDPDSPRRKFVTVQGELSECPQLRIIRIDGSLFFGAISHVQEQLQKLPEADKRKHLAIVASGINFIDIAGAEFLVNEASKRRQAGGGLYVIRAKEQVREFLERGGYADEIGHENCFQSKTDALRYIFSKLDKQVCESCQLRVFRECGAPAADTTEQSESETGRPLPKVGAGR